MSPAAVVHQVATDGFAKGDLYDQHRPTYPAEAVSRLLTHLGLAGKQSARIIDLGAGTGKFTEALAGREENYEVLAVEPLDSMRDVLAKKGLKGVEVKDGTATEIGVVDGWADAVVVAQYTDPIRFATEEALAEIHRVLKPGAKLGLIWNIDEYNRPKDWPATTQWEKAMGDYVHTLAADQLVTRFRDQRWPAVFDKQAEREKPLFSTPIKSETLPWAIHVTRDGFVSRMSTLSHIALLEGEEREAFEAKVDEILEGDVKMDEQGRLEAHGLTYFAWSEKL
ncbi:hypothetical protein NLU13_3807 [Sarocladium strictum]|uniref:Methyltransferase type 11 domain-containing protein n=1 Tax=Sarocladium strictum TaxID=5046 RepID=A0AA39GI26_SARSR|nr:hypothetical protein NLU13_3807 [Sarocladium strictum]